MYKPEETVTAYSICIGKIQIALSANPPQPHQAIQAIHQFIDESEHIVLHTLDDDAPVCHLDIYSRYIHILYGAGINTVIELQRCSRDRLLGLKDLGVGGYDHLVKALALVNREFTDYAK